VIPPVSEWKRNVTGYNNKPAFFHHPEFGIGGQTARLFMGVNTRYPHPP
jgi:hypothetical protein